MPILERTAMSYQIKISGDGKYIRVQATGNITVDVARQWSHEVKRMSDESGIRHFLFDLRNAENTSSLVDIYNFAYRDADRIGLVRDVFSAILVDPKDKSHNFVELTMRNAGYNVKLFTDEESALKWFEEDVP
jgi:hypothetical protein